VTRAAAAPLAAAPASYRALDATRILATVGRLCERIDERFPGSGLGGVCRELQVLARDGQTRSRELGRPILWLRVCTIAVALAILGTSVALFVVAGAPREQVDAVQLVQLLEAAINDAVLLGAAVYFLVSLELRIRRGRALAALHELRSLAHIVDMHQLTKDPDRVVRPGPETPSSPPRIGSAFELGRYLDYCSEMLSLAGKVAALYVQEFEDAVVLGAVDEVEALCSGLSRKIWQKISLLEAPTGAPAA
jgi:hypothetical protein